MRHFEVARNHIRVGRAGAHGLRKGAGSAASSATTDPPSFVSVAARGEWSIGKVLDVYFKFAMGGDQYLGRILALLDPNETTFAILPPHWINPIDSLVLKGIAVNFGKIATAHCDTNHDPSGLLSLLLASIVYHSNWLKSICAKYPSHPFHLIPILNDNELLLELKKLVTLEPNDHVPMATGIPAHVSHNKKLDQIMAKCDATHDMVSGFKDDIRTHIFQAVDEKVAGEGGVNHSILQVSLEGLKNEILARLESVTFNSRDRIGPAEDLPQVGGAVFAVASPHQFVYGGKFWCLPEAFQFPVGATRQSGWRMWLTGSSFMDPDGTKEWRLKPFRLINGKDLHSTALKNMHKIQWKPIFSMMEEAPNLNIPPKVENIDDEFIRASYDIATEYLRSRVSYIFAGTQEATHESYTVGTWSFKIKPSEVKKRGTDADKAKLPADTLANQPHKAKRTISNSGLRHQPRKIAKKGTGKRSALETSESAEA